MALVLNQKFDVKVSDSLEVLTKFLEKIIVAKNWHSKFTCVILVASLFHSGQLPQNLSSQQCDVENDMQRFTVHKTYSLILQNI